MIRSLLTVRSAGLVPALLLLAIAALSPSFASTPDDPPAAPSRIDAPTTTFRVERLAEGVLLFLPREERFDRTNALVIEREDGPLVIEAQPTPDAARLFLADLQAVVGQPPRYLVLSHPHAESAGGASAFPEETLIIGTEGYKEALADPAFDFGAEARERSRGVASWEDPPRVPPTLVLFARARLDDPVRPVELLPNAPAHTEGDLLVQLPRQQILYAGALFPADRNPYAVGAHVGGWLAALNNIAKSRPSTVVPLRGEAGPVRQLRLRRDDIAWLRGQVDLGFIEGLNAERIPAWVLESDGMGERFDTGARPNFLLGLIEQTVSEAEANRRKRGYD